MDKASSDDLVTTLIAALRGATRIDDRGVGGIGAERTYEEMEAIRRVCETARVAIETEAEKPRSIW